jgi:hypothetical protein
MTTYVGDGLVPPFLTWTLNGGKRSAFTPLPFLLSFSETSVLTRATRHDIPEDGILYSHRRENLKSYIALTDWVL